MLISANGGVEEIRRWRRMWVGVLGHIDVEVSCFRVVLLEFITAHGGVNTVCSLYGLLVYRCGCIEIKSGLMFCWHMDFTDCAIDLRYLMVVGGRAVQC